MVHADISTCYHTSYEMVGQDVVSLVQLDMWHSGAINHGFAVSKNEANIIDRNAQILEGITMINNLLNASSARNKFSAICSGLRNRLLLTMPINRSIVVEMKYSGHHPLD